MHPSCTADIRDREGGRWYSWIYEQSWMCRLCTVGLRELRIVLCRSCHRDQEQTRAERTPSCCQSVWADLHAHLQAVNVRHNYIQGRNHRGGQGGRVPRAPYHVPPTSTWQQTSVCLRSWLLTSDVALLQRITRPTLLLHVIKHYTT